MLLPTGHKSCGCRVSITSKVRPISPTAKQITKAEMAVFMAAPPSDWNTSSLIDDAITEALTSGRGGKGCVVVFAAGNNNGSIIYPARSNPAILVVGDLWGKLRVYPPVGKPGGLTWGKGANLQANGKDLTVPNW